MPGHRIVAVVMVFAFTAGAEDLTSDERRWATQYILSLNSASPRIRDAAAKALGAIGTDALPLVVKRSGQLNRDEAWAALAEACAAMGRSDAGKRLRELESAWPKKARKRLEALAKSLDNVAPLAPAPKVIWPEPHKPTLNKVRKLLDKFEGANRYSSDDPNVKAIVELGHDAVPALIRILRAGSGRRGMLVPAATDALKQLVVETDRNLIAGLLAEGLLDAAKCLVRIPGPKSLDALLFPVERGRINFEMIDALRRYRKEPRMRKALVTYLARYGKSQDYDAGVTAEFVGEIREFTAIPVLERLAALPVADKHDAAFRRGVATGLVKLGARAGFPMLMDVLEAKGRMNNYHRHEAGQLLNDLTGQRLYVGNSGGAGNFKDAAKAFRKWFKKNWSALEYDRETGRWSVP